MRQLRPHGKSKLPILGSNPARRPIFGRLTCTVRSRRGGAMRSIAGGQGGPGGSRGCNAPGPSAALPSLSNQASRLSEHPSDLGRSCRHACSSNKGQRRSQGRVVGSGPPPPSGRTHSHARARTAGGTPVLCARRLRTPKTPAAAQQLARPLLTMPEVGPPRGQRARPNRSWGFVQGRAGGGPTIGAGGGGYFGAGFCP
jgi:hypothetical protein